MSVDCASISLAYKIQYLCAVKMVASWFITEEDKIAHRAGTDFQLRFAGERLHRGLVTMSQVIPE